LVLVVSSFIKRAPEAPVGPTFWNPPPTPKGFEHPGPTGGLKVFLDKHLPLLAWILYSSNYASQCSFIVSFFFSFLQNVDQLTMYISILFYFPFRVLPTANATCGAHVADFVYLYEEYRIYHWHLEGILYQS
jgi:hypothetical protein